MEPDAATDQCAQSVIGAAIEVHRELGPGFRESVYEEALAFEFRSRGIAYKRQLSIPILYKGNRVGKGRMDFLIDTRLVVEIKCTEGLPPLYTSQVLSYLKASHLQLALLINFNVTLLKHGIRRIILSK